jgi:hypothetical protein
LKLLSTAKETLQTFIIFDCNAFILLNKVETAHLPEIERWHGLFHIRVKNVALLAGENIENANGTISAASCYVLVVPVEPDRKGGHVCASKNVLC